jgi:hypothetical protein
MRPILAVATQALFVIVEREFSFSDSAMVKCCANSNLRIEVILGFLVPKRLA